MSNTRDTDIDEILEEMFMVGVEHEKLTVPEIDKLQAQAKAAITKKLNEARIEIEKENHIRLEVAKSMVVKYSNEHEALGIGWVISGIDRMAYDSNNRIAKLQAKD